ncbi:MAG: hypothetical protein QW057_07190 [Candidatus Bathyarchaeia archaeon]
MESHAPLPRFRVRFNRDVPRKTWPPLTLEELRVVVDRGRPLEQAILLTMLHPPRRDALCSSFNLRA